MQVCLGSLLRILLGSRATLQHHKWQWAPLMQHSSMSGTAVVEDIVPSLAETLVEHPNIMRPATQSYPKERCLQAALKHRCDWGDEL